jgi:deoxyribonuclease-4
MILFGPGGNCAPTTIDSLNKLKKIGLTSQEIEFVYGIYMNNKEAKEVGKLAKKLNIKLSIHAPYYINLASLKKENITKSKRWILASCERGHYLHAENIVFHPGFYHNRTEKEVFEIIKNEIEELMQKIKENKWKVKLAPETTGKKSAFGSLDEIIELVKKTKCNFCIDFAHLYARNNGKINYEEILKKVKPIINKILHCHFSSIEFTDKGEKRHLNISHEKPSFKELAKVLLKKKINANIICETPRQYLDSIDMKKIIEELKNN